MPIPNRYKEVVEIFQSLEVMAGLIDSNKVYLKRYKSDDSIIIFVDTILEDKKITNYDHRRFFFNVATPNLDTGENFLSFSFNLNLKRFSDQISITAFLPAVTEHEIAGGIRFVPDLTQKMYENNLMGGLVRFGFEDINFSRSKDYKGLELSCKACDKVDANTIIKLYNKVKEININAFERAKR